ncbi:helix-turn-helix transcriptional regulator [Candidatus Bathyarchaeota archaeon]|nr:helix-turn-helix transcriptional regulator [Candidatus Bathyarchaeota archaeon]MBS7630776.1 helix-turn-helix transcriptional regulator [Candidatus Bathyarchaeota archaeon]
MINEYSSKLAINKHSDKELFPENENDVKNYIDFYRKLLLSCEKNNFQETLKIMQKLLSLNEKIFSSPSTAEVFAYFCLHGAATAWILQTELRMPEATVYRTLKILRALDMISPAVKISKIKYSKGGPRPIVWALKGASGNEVSKAFKLHFKKLSPKFRIAEEVAQTILDKYLTENRRNEITFREIIIHVKELNMPFRAPDIADLTADYLLENGVKVWR